MKGVREMLFLTDQGSTDHRQISFMSTEAPSLSLAPSQPLDSTCLMVGRDVPAALPSLLEQRGQPSPVPPPPSPTLPPTLTALGDK